jgi:tripartite-type tricarboxylate transporter receptor subunit TctC
MRIHPTAAAAIGILFTCGLSLVSSLAIAAAANTFPTRPIRLITPFAPGATTDALSRIIAVHMGDNWKQSVIVDNRPGAGGMLGTEIASRAPADGHTLVNVISSHSVHPFINVKMPYDAIKDFAPVIPLARVASVLVVPGTSQITSITELVAAARANPGKISFGSAGTGSSSHLTGEFFKMLAKVEITHVPYKGGAPALTDVLGGNIPLVIGTTTTVTPFVRSGKLRALAVTSAKRSKLLPEVPALAEQGFPEIDAVEWWAILAPAGTPRDIALKLNAEIARIMTLPDVTERLTSFGVEFIGGSPNDLLAFLKREMARWGAVVKAAKITPQ